MSEPTASRLAALAALEEHGPQSYKELARRLGLGEVEMHRCLMRLATEGMVHPVATVDRPAQSRGPRTWRWATSKAGHSFEQRIADLEAKVHLLEQALLYGVGKIEP